MDKEVRMRVGKVIKALREKRGWSQEQLAERSGAYDSGAAISFVESGGRDVPVTKLVKLIEALLEEEQQDIVVNFLELLAKTDRHQHLGAIKDLIKISLSDKTS